MGLGLLFVQILPLCTCELEVSTFWVQLQLVALPYQLESSVQITCSHIYIEDLVSGFVIFEEIHKYQHQIME